MVDHPIQYRIIKKVYNSGKIFYFPEVMYPYKTEFESFPSEFGGDVSFEKEKDVYKFIKDDYKDQLKEKSIIEIDNSKLI